MNQIGQGAAHGLPVPFRPGVDVISTAPLEVYRTRVPPEWIDYNGHMNVAFYVMAFDHATDRFFELIDLGEEYVGRTNHSAFVMETHVTYRQEVSEADPLRFTLQVLDADEKRLHLYFEMFHVREDYLSAASELLITHVDLDARRSAAFPKDLQARVDAVKAAHAGLPRPEFAGGNIAIRRRSPPP
jgi:acyl-CoA thioester hydrolase